MKATRRHTTFVESTKRQVQLVGPISANTSWQHTGRAKGFDHTGFTVDWDKAGGTLSRGNGKAGGGIRSLVTPSVTWYVARSISPPPTAKPVRSRRNARPFEDRTVDQLTSPEKNMKRCSRCESNRKTADFRKALCGARRALRGTLSQGVSAIMDCVPARYIGEAKTRLQPPHRGSGR